MPPHPFCGRSIRNMAPPGVHHGNVRKAGRDRSDTLKMFSVPLQGNIVVVKFSKAKSIVNGVRRNRWVPENQG